MDALSVTIEGTMSELQDFINNNNVHSYRFIVYAISNGNTPDKQLEIDTIAYPDNKYQPFLSWAMTKISEWKNTMGLPRHHLMNMQEWKDYDTWLFNKYNKEN